MANVYFRRADSYDGNLIRGTVESKLVREALEDRMETIGSLSNSRMSKSYVRSYKELLNTDETESQEKRVVEVVHDFQTNLDGRQVRSNKFVCIILEDDRITVAHGNYDVEGYYNEDTEEIEEGRTIVSNEYIISAVEVEKTDSDYILRYCTRSDSDAVEDYVGASKKRTSKNRTVSIHSKYHGEEPKTIFKSPPKSVGEEEQHTCKINIEKGTVNIRGDEHPIDSVTWNGKYSEDDFLYRFLSDLSEWREDLHEYRTVYTEVKRLAAEDEEIEQLYEDENMILKCDRERAEIRPTERDDTHVIFGNTRCSLGSEVAKEVMEAITGNSICRIYHPMGDYQKEPLTFQSDGWKLIFLTIPQDSLSKDVKEALNKIYQKVVTGAVDNKLRQPLLLILFDVLRKSLRSRNILTVFLQSIVEAADTDLAKTDEGEARKEGVHLEYKGYYEDDGNLADAKAEEMAEYIRQQSEDAPISILFWGIEDDGEVEPVEDINAGGDPEKISEELEELGAKKASVVEIETRKGKVVAFPVIGQNEKERDISEGFGELLA